MFGIAFNRVYKVEASEDIVQEAGLRLMQQRTMPDDERGLAYTVASHSASEYIEREHRHCRDSRKTEPLDTANPAHHPPAPSAEREAMARLELLELAKTMPGEVVLSAQGYTLREISDLLGVPKQTAWERIGRWRRENKER